MGGGELILWGFYINLVFNGDRGGIRELHNIVRS